MRSGKGESHSLKKVEITLQDIFWALRKYLLWILLTTIVFGVGAWFYTSNYVTSLYTTRLSMAIRSSERGGTAITATEQTADARLATFCCELMTSDAVANAVSEELGGLIPAASIKSMLYASNKSDSPMIHVRVVSSDPQIAYQIALTVAKVAPEVIPDLAGAGEMNMVNAPTLPSSPYYPSVTENVTIGLVLGFLLSCAVIILFAVLNTTIWREEDLERAFDVPVLGSVPSMSHSSAVLSKNRGNPT